MITQKDFNFKEIIFGKTLEIKLTDASVAEHLICIKLVRHIVEAINFNRQLQNKSFVEKTILNCMEVFKNEKKRNIYN